MNDGRDGVLHRWSRRKHAAKRADARPRPADTPPAQPLPVAPSTGSLAAAPAATTAAVPAAAPASAPAAGAAPEAVALPPIESLTPQSDFKPFMRPGVDDSLKRAALKKLFADPHFNVMDGLDVYIDDYSKPDPIPPDMLAKLMQNRALFDPPRTRVNAEGVVEDVPDEVPPSTVAEQAPTDPAHVPQSPPQDAVAAPAADDDAARAPKASEPVR